MRFILISHENPFLKTLTVWSANLVFNVKLYKFIIKLFELKNYIKIIIKMFKLAPNYWFRIDLPSGSLVRRPLKTLLRNFANNYTVIRVLGVGWSVCGKTNESCPLGDWCFPTNLFHCIKTLQNRISLYSVSCYRIILSAPHISTSWHWSIVYVTDFFLHLKDRVVMSNQP